MNPYELLPRPSRLQPLASSLTRRDWLRRAGLVPLALAAIRTIGENRTLAAESPPGRHKLGLVIHSYWVRGARPLPPEFGPISQPLAFVELAASLGAPGVQTKIGTPDAASLQTLREALERRGMYIEGIVALPKSDADVPRFEAELLAARQAGARIVRTVCMNGRRYEAFDSAEQFAAFADSSWQALTRAEPIARRHSIRLAVENHKDWRVDELTGILRRLSSEAVGICLDTGNSIALLEDPLAVIEAYAPWTITTHLKDMAVAESDDGFLLAEVPLGTGIVDPARAVATLRKARPDVPLNLEMITRDPLRVPCLSEKYWATLGDVRGRQLARRLAMVRQQPPKSPLPRISGLAHAEQLRAEADNILACIRYAQEHF